MTVHENALTNRAAKYWEGSISRKEIQPIFDAYGQTITNLGQTVAKLDMALAYAFERLGYSMEEFTAWAEAKAKMIQEAQPQPAENSEPIAEQPLITLE